MTIRVVLKRKRKRKRKINASNGGRRIFSHSGESEGIRQLSFIGKRG